MSKELKNITCPICHKVIGKETKAYPEHNDITFHNKKGCGCLIVYKPGISARKLQVPEGIQLQTEHNDHWRMLMQARGKTIIKVK